MKILLVDDSKSARYALRLQLQRHGMEVETADAAESALEHIRNTPPDAIFMDHTMPGMSGFEALDILKTSPSTARIPVIMCTSNEDPEFIAQAKRKGALDILSKSTAPEKLGGLLDRLRQAEASSESLPATAGATGAVEPVPAGHAEVASTSADRLDDERLDARVRALIGPLLDDHSERLETDLIARVEERIEARVHASVGPLMEDLAKRLGEDLIAKINERLVSGFEREAERLQKQVLEAQSGQAQQALSQLLDDAVPLAVRQQIEKHSASLTEMVREAIDTSMDALVREPSFIRRLSHTAEAMAADNAERIAKAKATEIAERVASERANAVAELVVQSSKRSESSVHLLSAGAALVGVISAAIVFFLLS